MRTIISDVLLKLIPNKYSQQEVNPLKRNLEAVFIFRAERRKIMRPLVQSVSASISGNEAFELREGILKDIAFAQRKSRLPLVNKIVKRRIERFYVQEADAKRPDELKEWQFRDIKRSAIHLPPNLDTLNKIKHAFEENTARCNFTDLEIRYCRGLDVIIFSIDTRI